MSFPFIFKKINAIKYDYDLEGCSRIILSGKLSMYAKELYVFQTNLEENGIDEINNITGTRSEIYFIRKKLLDEESSSRHKRLIDSNANGTLSCISALQNRDRAHPDKKPNFFIQDLELCMQVLIYLSDLVFDELCKTTQHTRNISAIDVYPFDTYQTKEGTQSILDKPLELRIKGLDDGAISKLENPTLEETGQLLIKDFNLQIALKNN